MVNWWLNRAGDIWALIFALSFVLSLVVGAVQSWRGKALTDTPLLPLLLLLHMAWVVPLTIVIAVRPFTMLFYER